MENNTFTQKEGREIGREGEVVKGRNNRGIVEESKKNTCLFFFIRSSFCISFYFRSISGN